MADWLAVRRSKRLIFYPLLRQPIDLSLARFCF
jgi:hypothetical protein